MAPTLITWDGRSRAADPPFGAAVVVYRRGAAGLEFLVLHRAQHGPAYDGDWAWTPPSGARWPGEAVEECARRELMEESGLAVPIHPLPGGSLDWRVFTAEVDVAVGGGDDVVLHDAEHDRFAWVPLDEAVRRCLPATVGEAFRRAAESLLGGGRSR